MEKRLPLEIKKLKVSAPGRICLFGEHQDYLGLPVITAAINLRIEIEGERRNDKQFIFHLPDINKTDSFSFDSPINYTQDRDYLRSALNVILRERVNIPTGYECTVRGKIPINSGTSSSSALIVAWIKFLLTIAEDVRANEPMEIAKLAHRAEVLEFKEPGGMMDHYACSLGGVLFIEFKNPVKIERLKSNLGTFVLGDSLQAKNTTEILARVKDGVLNIVANLQNRGFQIDLEQVPFDQFLSQKQFLSNDQLELINSTLRNRDITFQAYQLFQRPKFEKKQFGNLLSSCHKLLSDNLKISTPKLDRLIERAIAAGADGGKLNGSGGGGCMFVAADKYPEKIAEAIQKAGGKPYIIEVDEGVRIENIELQRG